MAHDKISIKPSSFLALSVWAEAVVGARGVAGAVVLLDVAFLRRIPTFANKLEEQKDRLDLDENQVENRDEDGVLVEQGSAELVLGNGRVDGDGHVE